MANSRDRIKKKSWTLILVPPTPSGKTREVKVKTLFAQMISTAILVMILGSAVSMKQTARSAVMYSEKLAETQQNVIGLIDSVRVLGGIVAEERAGFLPPRNMILPVRGRISSGFSLSRLHPLLNIFRPHNGVDLRATYGSNIVSPAKGRVRRVGWSAGHGKIVEVEHTGGVISRFAHCSTILVKEGQMVTLGQPVAQVGTTGLTTGPHVHFEMTVKGRNVDPIKYLAQSRDDCQATNTLASRAGSSE